MLPSRFFSQQNEDQEDTQARKKLKRSEKEEEQKAEKKVEEEEEEEEEELPDINQLIQHNPTLSPHTLTQTETLPGSPHPRLPSRTRLAGFLNSELIPSSTTQQESSQPSDNQKNLQLKLSNQLQNLVKYEQPQSIWQPGFESCDRKPSPLIQAQSPTLPTDDNQEHKQDPLPPNKKKVKLSKNTNLDKKPTQLELQWAEFKKQYPGLIILIEVGFKIQLFGSDAVLASRILSIGHLAIPGRESAFFPKTNLHLHLSRLVMAGYKVGLVSQSETRSLKKLDSDPGNKRCLFKRHLSGIYSLSTWTEHDTHSSSSASATLSTHDLPANSLTDVNPTQLLQNWIVSFYEPLVPSQSTSSSHIQPKVELNMVAICPQNGDIVWDSWIDDPIRSKLETRMMYFKPVEILTPLSGLQPASEKLMNWIINDLSNRSYAKPRLESTDRDYNPQTAYELVTRFCQPLAKRQPSPDAQTTSTVHEAPTEPEFLHHIVELPDGVLIALAGVIMHMKTYQLESIFRQPSQFKSFSSQSCMVLDANTLRNLEIFENSTDRSERGSLFWVLDRTKTNMGKRLLKQWIGKPLVDFKMLKERADAIHELTISQTHPVFIRMRRMLGTRLPDLDKSLVRIQYGKCTEKELLRFLEVMDELTGTFGGVARSTKTKFQSSLLNEIFQAFSAVREQTAEYRSELDAKAINKGQYDEMFTKADERYPELIELKDCISCVEAELADHLQFCRNLLQNPKLEYITIGVDELLVEVRIQNLDLVPEDWITLNGTRAVHRFRTPQAQKLLDERNKYRDMLSQTTRGCFAGFLRSMEESYIDFRNAINKFAQLDCLMGVAKAGIDNHYCRPILLDDDHPRTIEVVDGRHPIVEQLTDDPLVANDFCFKNDPSNLSAGLSTMILTGNNMGGKSVTAKMIACIVILAQIGSYVPATRAKMALFDGCYTRMGMTEELSQGRSAFMVEMNETSKIIKSASNRSLVIFDELGYGTSTFDGLAIASATLHHLVSRIGCFTVFITHYPQLNELAIQHPNTVKSYHMKFIERPGNFGEGGHPEITFLYKLVVGLATKSHGIHVAKLAGLPASILDLARRKSALLEDTVARKKHLYRTSSIQTLLIGLLASSSSAHHPTPSDRNRPESALVSLAQAVLRGI